MTKIYSSSLKILILGIAYFPYTIFADHFDDEIVKHIALVRKKSDMILVGKSSGDEFNKTENTLNTFCFRIIERNNSTEFYKVMDSDFKFTFLHNLRLWFKKKGTARQKKEVLANIINLHGLLVVNGLFQEDEYIQKLLLNNISGESLDIELVKNIKTNILSGTFAPLFSEINELFKDKDIENYFNRIISNASALRVNHLTLYDFSIIAVKARHGDRVALNILLEKFNSLTENEKDGVKYLPMLLAYTNQLEAVEQMLNVYTKQDIRPDKENSLHNNCACSLHMLIRGFPAGNALLGIIGDSVKTEFYRKWIKENKGEYAIMNASFLSNKNLINDIIDSTLKNYQENMKKD